jgi:hypothetical protein
MGEGGLKNPPDEPGPAADGRELRGAVARRGADRANGAMIGEGGRYVFLLETAGLLLFDALT